MTNSKSDPFFGKPTIFYGWYVVAAVFCISAAAAGIIYAFPVFVDSFANEFDANRTEVSLIFAVCECLWFLSGFVGGVLSDRYGPRIVGLFGCLFMASGLAIAGSANSMLVVYLAYGAGVGIGGGLLYIPAISIVQRWFKKNRGLASGIAICGTGVGTLLIPLLATLLLENNDWRVVHLILAGIALIVCGASCFVLVSHPGRMGLFPDGGSQKESAKEDQDISGFSFAEAISHHAFWLLYAASLLSSAVIFANHVHLVPYALDNGNSMRSSVSLISALGVSSILGRFLLGGLADYMRRRIALMLMFAGLAASLLWLYLIPVTLVSLVIYSVIFGMFYGGYITVLPVITMDYFGGRYISSIIGGLYTSWAAGALIGPPLAGYMFDHYSNYSQAILVAVVFVVISAICCLIMRDPRVQH